MPSLSSPALSRLPGLLLLAGMAALYLGLPYATLDADVAVFGLMGEDVVRHHYSPTLLYGQNYLFSPTPWLYALWRTVLPAGVPPVYALVLAGSLLTLGGLALVLEAFRRVQARHGGGLFWPSLFLPALLAANVPFVVDQAKNSGVEICLFLLGVMALAGARIEEAIPAAGPSGDRRPAWSGWLLLGAATGFAVISRPQMAIYGLSLAGLLLLRLWIRTGIGNAIRAAGWLAAGLAAGYMPMLAHRAFRAHDWPFAFQLPLRAGDWAGIAKSARTTFGSILPVVFGVRPEMAAKPLRYAVWLAAVLPCYGWALWKRPERVSLLDHGLLLGSLAVLLALCLVPALSQNVEQRRYGLSVFVTGAWLCCRFVPAPGWRNAVVGLLCLAMLGMSVPRWKDRLEKSAILNRRMRDARTEFIPELAAADAVIAAHYWDAYLLQFLAEGRLRIEAFPWGVVRTYGRVAREDFDRRTLWLAPQGRERELAATWEEAGGADMLQGAVKTGLKHRFLGRSCELWESPDRSLASRLMLNYHPLYFRTPYPPGSGPIRPPE